jgi:hypothetical protein
MKRGVYLAGAMEGVPEKTMRGWRDYATSYLADRGIPVKDPCRRKKFHDEPYSQNLSRRIVKMDLQDISECNVVLANLSEEARGGGRAWGTLCEIAHSHTKNKIIVVVMDRGFNHPFVDFYATEVHHDLDAALTAVKHYYG